MDFLAARKRISVEMLSLLLLIANSKLNLDCGQELISRHLLSLTYIKKLLPHAQVCIAAFHSQFSSQITHPTITLAYHDQLIATNNNETGLLLSDWR